MKPWVRYGFWAAAAYNIVGITTFSKAFTSEVLFATDPAMFGPGGCVLVCIWGLAYLSLSPHADRAPWVSLAFSVEKLFYVGWWARWMLNHAAELPAIAAQDPLAGSFYGVYGLGDGAFCLFFAAVFFTYRGAAQPVQ